MSSYKDLIAWQKAIELVKEVYKITIKCPDTEKFNLITQANKSAVSVASNIAEGWGRQSKKSFINFLKVARGSLFELETQMIIIEKLKYIDETEKMNKVLDMITEEVKILNGLIKRISIDPSK